MINDLGSHYELWLNSEDGRPTVIKTELLVDLRNELKVLEDNKPLIVMAPSGIAGADIRHMAEMTKEEAREFSSLGVAVISEIISFTPVTIGCFDKFVLGGGFEIALACDIILVTKDCKVGFPEVTLGIIPGFLGVELSSSKCNSLIRELLFTGRIFNASSCERFSAFNYIEKNWTDCSAVVNDFISRFDETSYLALGALKSHYLRSLKNIEQSCLPEVFSALFEEHDQKEGMRAFLEKRKPLFMRNW